MDFYKFSFKHHLMNKIEIFKFGLNSLKQYCVSTCCLRQFSSFKMIISFSLQDFVRFQILNST
jgi:hypothetical protein